MGYIYLFTCSQKFFHRIVSSAEIQFKIPNILADNRLPSAPFDTVNIAGISSWSRRVGRRIDQLRTAESSDKLNYSVQSNQSNGSSEPGVRSTVTRRVSRVESLRRLILGASQIDSRRLFDRKKHRYTVDKSIGDLIVDRIEL